MGRPRQPSPRLGGAVLSTFALYLCGCHLMLPLPAGEDDAGQDAAPADGRPLDGPAGADGPAACDPQQPPTCDGPVQVHCSAAGALIRFECRQGCAEGHCIQCVDQDLDHYGEGVGCLGPDCDDANPNRNPGQAELCNNLDDNCNKLVDDALTRPCETTCGKGQEICQGGTWLACSAPQPQPEVCDGQDNNCDGNIDEGVQIDYYADTDSDGYGDTSTVTAACSAPAGHVEQAGDCNDNDDRVHPGQTQFFGTASAGHGFDFNCDGQVEVKHSAITSCGARSKTICGMAAPGWKGPVPDCGESGLLLAGCFLEVIDLPYYPFHVTVCSEMAGSTTKQGCR